jgi:hypothetical protein
LQRRSPTTARSSAAGPIAPLSCFCRSRVSSTARPVSGDRGPMASWSASSTPCLTSTSEPRETVAPGSRPLSKTSYLHPMGDSCEEDHRYPYADRRLWDGTRPDADGGQGA